MEYSHRMQVMLGPQMDVYHWQMVIILEKRKRVCSVNFLFFELSCEILCERNLFFIVFRKLQVVRY
jgi:hypothetical protein